MYVKIATITKNVTLHDCVELKAHDKYEALGSSSNNYFLSIRPNLEVVVPKEYCSVFYEWKGEE